jgi:hypothetical protein
METSGGTSLIVNVVEAVFVAPNVSVTRSLSVWLPTPSAVMVLAEMVGDAPVANVNVFALSMSHA